ncbi:hypothetical protein [Rhizobium sp. HT1-10]|uniref:hypothetical protein n=1 Tax=Rhizobium sp. HT1-10 TaxID=3111638 RepID=UPI003C1ED529
MTRSIAETSSPAEQGSRLFARLLAIITRKSLPMGKLDLEAMPDRVKRDLGFLDGRDPRHVDERTR